MIETAETSKNTISNCYNKAKAFFSNNPESPFNDKQKCPNNELINNFFEEDTSGIPLQTMMRPKYSLSENKMSSAAKRRTKLQFKNPFIDVVQIESFKKENYNRSYESMRDEDNRRQRKCCMDRCILF